MEPDVWSAAAIELGKKRLEPVGLLVINGNRLRHANLSAISIKAATLRIAKEAGSRNSHSEKTVSGDAPGNRTK
jgi:hypothetical protein